MSGPLIVPIVEGHGEVEAVPVLIHRIFKEWVPGVVPIVNAPIRVKAGSFLKDKEYFFKHFSAAAEKAAQRNGTVLILLDCEDHCPAELGPNLLERVKQVRADIRCYVALAYREYETWFLAAASSLRGREGLPSNLTPPHSPESIRGAKEWLRKQAGFPYDPIMHQAKFTRCFNLQQARGIRSFDRLVRILAKINPA